MGLDTLLTFMLALVLVVGIPKVAILSPFQSLLFFLISLFFYGISLKISFFLVGRYRKKTDNLNSVFVTSFGLFVFGVNLVTCKGYLPWLDFIYDLNYSIYLMFFIVILLCGFAFEYIFEGKTGSFWKYIHAKFQGLLPFLILYSFVFAIHDLILILAKFQVFPNSVTSLWLRSHLSQWGYFVLFVVTVAFVWPHMIVSLWKCEALGKDDAKAKAIREFLEFSGISFTGVFLWPHPEDRVNAAVMGLPGSRYLLISKKMFEEFSPQELVAVVGHEVGHIKRHHFFWQFFLLLGYVVLIRLVIEFLVHNLHKIDAVRMFLERLGPNSISAYLIFGILPFALFIVLYFRVLFGFFSRGFEREADLYGAFASTPEALISALKKMARLNREDFSAKNWHHYGFAERCRFLEKALDMGVADNFLRQQAVFRSLFSISIVVVGLLDFLF